MKRLRLFALAFAATLAALALSNCSKDPDGPDGPDGPEGPGQTLPDDEPARYFDIWVRAGGSGETAVLVQNTDNLEASASPMDFLNKGTDVTATLQEETTFRNGYYYQIPISNDRFGKYRILDGRLTVVAERPYGKNTFQTYRFTHAWINDNTLLIMSSNGSKDKIIWTKLDTRDMTILSEGELPIQIAAGGQFSTSGILCYRESDDTLIYFFQRKKTGDDRSFFAAFIRAADMTLLNEETISLEEDVQADGFYMGGTAYGELLQEKTFFDEKGHLYLSCDIEVNYPEKTARFIRIKKGEFSVDKTYKGYSGKTGKIVVSSFLTAGKALLYILDPAHTNAGWGSSGGYNCYYAIWDIASDSLSEIMFEGKPLPFSSGQWSQRHAIVGSKAYIGTNPENNEPTVYIYDIPTGKVEKGMSIREGYTFFRIVPMTRPQE